MPRPAGLLLALVSLLLVPARADLDAEVPPGLPLDGALPRRPLTDLFPPPRTRPRTGPPSPAAPDAPREDKPEPGTRERGPAQPITRGTTQARPSLAGGTRARAGSPTGSATGMGYARIATLDLWGELGWPPLPKVETIRIPTGSQPPQRPRTGDLPEAVKPGPETSAAYPPPLTQDLYWLVLGHMLWLGFHPNQTSTLETSERLLELGTPARAMVEHLLDVHATLATAGGRGSRGDQGFFQTLEKVFQGLKPPGVGLPGHKPRLLLDTSDPHRNLRLRVVGEELALGYAHALSGDFAPRTRGLPPGEAVEALAAYLAPGNHPLLRRNAAVLLGSYVSPLGIEALVSAAREGRDPVLTRRALVALLNAENPGGVQQALEGRQRLAPGAVMILARAGSERAVAPALALLADKDPEGWLLGIRALLAAGARPEQSLAGLQALGQRLRRIKPKKLWVRATLRSDNPDPEDLRYRVLSQALTLAKARLGDPAAQGELVKLVQGERSPQAIVRRTPVAAEATFGALLDPLWPTAIQTWGALEDGPALRRVLFDRLAELSLRIQALTALERSGLVTGEDYDRLVRARPGGLRALALEGLTKLEPERARQRARQALEELPELLAPALGAGGARPAGPDSKDPDTTRPGWQLEVISALKIVAQARSDAVTISLPGPAPLRLTPDGPELETLPSKTPLVIQQRAGDWAQVKATVADDGGNERSLEGFVALQKLGRLPPERDRLLAGVLEVAVRWELLLQARAKAKPPAPDPKTTPPTVAFLTNPVIQLEVPLLERVVAALGERPGREVRKVLVKVLEDGRLSELARGAAAQALARVDPSGVTAKGLVLGLKDAAGWVRYCCYRGLSWIAYGELDAFCDWLLAGTPREKKRYRQAAKAWQDWADQAG